VAEVVHRAVDADEGAIEAAVGKAINSGLRTGDIFNAADSTARKTGTREMGDAIAAGI